MRTDRGDFKGAKKQQPGRQDESQKRASQKLEESFRKEEVGQQSQRLPGDPMRTGLGSRSYS